MFNQGENLEPSVATDDDRSITAGYIKCGTQKAKGKRQSAKRITQNEHGRNSTARKKASYQLIFLQPGILPRDKKLTFLYAQRH